MPNYDKLPIFPLHAVLFPQMSLPLHIFEPRYRLMVARCLEEGSPFGIVLLTDGSEVDHGDESQQQQVSPIGTLARIERAEHLPDGRYYIEARGECRFKVQEIYRDEDYLTARVRPMWEQSEDPLSVQPVFDRACELFRDYISTLLNEMKRHVGSVQLPHDPTLLSYAIGASLQITLAEKQRLLEAASPGERLRWEVEMLQLEKETQEFFADESVEGDDEPPDRKKQQRTIMRVDPSYVQYFFSRN